MTEQHCGLAAEVQSRSCTMMMLTISIVCTEERKNYFLLNTTVTKSLFLLITQKEGIPP